MRQEEERVKTVNKMIR